MGITGGAFDVMFIFGMQQPLAGGTGEAVTEEVARVSMSWGHAKSIIPLLAKVVAEYESKYGEVPAPGFDENWKA
jgi:hypothetical protein